MTKDLTYRPDVDGLRAFAVISVLLFHANFAFAEGGFVGVDIFFVISGYLITGIILKQIDNNNFSYFEFLIRRAKRIIPALFFVTLISALILPIILLPPHTQDFGKSILYVPIFATNLYFHTFIDYFSQDTSTIPLLHTWSLSIEWQYYLVFPLMFIGIYKYFPKYLITISIIFIFSNLLFVQIGGNFNFSPPYINHDFLFFNQPAYTSFYLPTGRAWEFVIGSIVTLYARKYGNITGIIGNIISLIGFGMILTSVLMYDHTTLFPSVYTLLPTLGTGFVILSAGKNIPVTKFLSHKYFVYIGAISYSLYLWHLPVFVALEQYDLALNDSYIFIPTFCALILVSHLSWKFIETPLRKTRTVSNSKFLIQLSTSCGILLALGSVFVYTNGFIDLYDDRDKSLLKTKNELSNYVSAKFGERGNLGFTPDKTTKVILIGDSYAQDFMNIIHEGNFFNNSDLTAIYISKRCQIFYSKNQETVIKKVDKPHCFASNGKTILENSQPLIDQADIIIMAASWKQWAIKLLPKTIAKLNLRDHQQLFVVGSKSFGKVNTKKLLDMNDQQRSEVRISMSDAFIKNNLSLKNILAEGRFLDYADFVADGNDQWPQFTPQMKLISFDGTHLTREGAKYISSLMEDHPLFNTE